MRGDRRVCRARQPQTVHLRVQCKAGWQPASSNPQSAEPLPKIAVEEEATDLTLTPRIQLQDVSRHTKLAILPRCGC
jgi:hypothetical protein